MILDYLIKKSDLSTVLKFVSPNLFKVVSPKGVLQMANALIKNQKEQKVWEAVSMGHDSQLAGLSLGVRFKQGVSLKNGKVLPGADDELKINALKLFFWQILNQKTWIIDFREKSFSSGEEPILYWHPSALYYQPSEEFLQSIRDLYCGYFLQDHKMFDQALNSLNLLGMKTTFLRHFGPEDQTRVYFKLADFQRTFAEIFETCSLNKISLKSEFLILGILLLGLYEFLEASKKSFDVRSAFLEAYSVSQLKSEGS